MTVFRALSNMITQTSRVLSNIRNGYPVNFPCAGRRLLEEAIKTFDPIMAALNSAVKQDPKGRQFYHITKPCISMFGTPEIEVSIAYLTKKELQAFCYLHSDEGAWMGHDRKTGISFSDVNKNTYEITIPVWSAGGIGYKAGHYSGYIGCASEAENPEFCQQIDPLPDDYEGMGSRFDTKDIGMVLRGICAHFNLAKMSEGKVPNWIALEKLVEQAQVGCAQKNLPSGKPRAISVRFTR